MAVNKHFHTSGSQAITSEKNLYRDLVTEAIQIYGHDVYYMDRTLVAEDTIMGEDTLSKFNSQHLIEMYMEDSEGGFAGAITAALFLKEFVSQNTQWVQFDIMAWNRTARPGRPVGGEAMGMRALYNVIESRFKKNQK